MAGCATDLGRSLRLRQRPAGIPPLAVAVLPAVPCYFLRTTSSALAPLGFTAISAALLFDSGIRPPFVVGNRGIALRDIDPSFAPAPRTGPTGSCFGCTNFPH